MRGLVWSALGVTLTLACQPPRPASHPERMADTLVNNACHFAFDCCAPVERGFLASLGGTAVNKGACIEALGDLYGGVFNEARAAIEAGTAVYDGEAAERCSLQDEIDACDAQAVLGVGLSRGVEQLLYGVDVTDRTCIALAERAFARGLVEHGGTCTSSIDCENLGTCIIDDNQSEGTCVVPADPGKDCTDRPCSDGFGCDAQSGMRCVDLRRADGTPCSADIFCRSNACVPANGVCFFSGSACDDDDDCPADDSCSFETVCGAAPTITVEMCDGL